MWNRQRRQGIGASKTIYCGNGHGFNTVGTEVLAEEWGDKVIAWLGWCDKCGARVVWKNPLSLPRPIDKK